MIYFHVCFSKNVAANRKPLNTKDRHCGKYTETQAYIQVYKRIYIRVHVFMQSYEKDLRKFLITLKKKYIYLGYLPIALIDMFKNTYR